MPLEALRYDVTPPGLHYLLIHYDIPAVDAGVVAARRRRAVDAAAHAWSSTSCSAVPGGHAAGDLECAGNGRARLRPRPVSQPWLVEAVGTAEWTGTPLAPLLDEAGVAPDAVDVVFTGADHGVERGVEQDYQRGLPLAEALRDETLLVVRDERRAAAAAARRPAAAGRARLVRHGAREVAARIDRARPSRSPASSRRSPTGCRSTPDDPGDPVTRIAPRALLVAAGLPGLHVPRPRVVRPGR